MSGDVTVNQKEYQAMLDELDKLRRFKQFVHDRLTAAGVPTHPDGPHSREGCRIGDRLDLVLGPIHPGGLEGKYGTIYSSNKRFHPGEPVFIIRATDRNAVRGIMDYAARCITEGCTGEHVEACVTHALRIRDWQTKHPELVKKPD